MYSSGRQSADEILIALVLEIGNYVFRNDLTNAFHANQLVVRCFAQSLHTAEVAGNGFGHHLAHEADAQCIEYSVERHFLATLNTIKHLLRHTFPASFNRKELVERQAVQIGSIVVGIICILTYLLGEDYLADIAVIYVVMSFIAVMMLCRIYINLYDRKKKEAEKK